MRWYHNRSDCLKDCKTLGPPFAAPVLQKLLRSFPCRFLRISILLIIFSKAEYYIITHYSSDMRLALGPKVKRDLQQGFSQEVLYSFSCSKAFFPVPIKMCNILASSSTLQNDRGTETPLVDASTLKKNHNIAAMRLQLYRHRLERCTLPRPPCQALRASYFHLRLCHDAAYIFWHREKTVSA